MHRCTRVRATPLWESSLCYSRRSYAIQLSGWGSLPVPFMARDGACLAGSTTAFSAWEKTQNTVPPFGRPFRDFDRCFKFAGLIILSAVGKCSFSAASCGSHEILTSEPK